MAVECPLCSLSKRERVLYEDDLIYLADTKELKGHKVRVMAVTKSHAPDPTFEERIRATVKLHEYMKEHAKVFYIVDSTFCSVPEHFHIVACDDEGGGDPMLYSTPRVRFPL